MTHCFTSLLPQFSCAEDFGQIALFRWEIDDFTPCLIPSEVRGGRGFWVVEVPGWGDILLGRGAFFSLGFSPNINPKCRPLPEDLESRPNVKWGGMGVYSLSCFQVGGSLDNIIVFADCRMIFAQQITSQIKDHSLLI